MTPMDVDIFDPVHLRDPFLAYATLREKGAVEYQATGAGWVVTRYDEVVRALSDHEAFSSRGLIYDREDTVFRGSRMMMNEDPPDHSRMRGVMQPSFSGHSVNDLSARVREITEELLRPFERGVPFDAIRELAIPLPVIVIAEMLGIDGRDFIEFRKWSDEMLAAVSLREGEAADESLRRGREATVRVRDYFTILVNECRARPRDGVLTRVARAIDAGTLTEGEALANLQLLLIAASCGMPSKKCCASSRRRTSRLESPRGTSSSRECGSREADAFTPISRAPTETHRNSRSPTSSTSRGEMPIRTSHSAEASRFASARRWRGSRRESRSTFCSPRHRITGSWKARTSSSGSPRRTSEASERLTLVAN